MCLAEACFFALASRISVALCTRAAFFSVPVFSPLPRRSTPLGSSCLGTQLSAVLEEFPGPQAKPLLTPLSCGAPLGRGLLLLAPLYTACALATIC